MSFEPPSTLLELSMKNLLRNEALAISVLQQLPSEFFPSLFKEAFKSRHMKILTAMVAVWPFVCLPVGAMMKVPDTVILQAILDGVDIMLTDKAHFRRSKLRVLDLRNMHNVFWDVWPGIQGLDCSKGTLSKKQTGNGHFRYTVRRLLKVVTDFDLRFDLNEQQAYLLQWAQQRKGSVRLCCIKMSICVTPLDTIMMVLKTFQPDYIEELELSTNWSLVILSHFAPCFGQMRNLRSLHLARIYLNTNKAVNTMASIEEKCAARFISQIAKLNCLQHLSMDGVYFSSKHMKKLFRCVKSPLETLSVSLCQISQSDLKHLSQCQRFFHLKHLNLFGVALFNLCPTHLLFLLKNVGDTLQSLELEHCRMGDSHLSALLPALSQCLQLTRVNLYDNDLSMSILKELLQSMTHLSKLTEEFYPAPLECYGERGHVLVDKFAKLYPDLLDILRSKETAQESLLWNRILPLMFSALCL
ncbi:PRAME family member 12-like [Peromyscus californicus insignis]|uniref:PRAME family member 12-like n=1 Tax=Peromyscus californicus insignis TaxID=564181 RepID=UPI0022A7F512|nr:PRAME family member 12-like [Peromyscus californicus insignis]